MHLSAPARWFAVVAVLSCVAVGCATSAAKEAKLEGPVGPDPRTLPPLPRSSIAAVLAWRGDLKLTDDQIATLDALEENLLKDNAIAREEFKEREKQAAETPEDRPSEPPVGGRAMDMGDERGPGMNGPGPNGMGEPESPMGSRAMRGSGGRGMGGPRPGAHRGGEDAPMRRRMLRARLDDNDAQAYLAAERVLGPEQQPRARAIASEYREAVADRRQALHRWRAATGEQAEADEP